MKTFSFFPSKNDFIFPVPYCFDIKETGDTKTQAESIETEASECDLKDQCQLQRLPIPFCCDSSWRPAGHLGGSGTAAAPEERVAEILPQPLCKHGEGCLGGALLHRYLYAQQFYIRAIHMPGRKASRTESTNQV